MQWSRRFVLLLLLLAGGMGVVLAEGAPTSLAEALESLRAAGYEVVYSDELVAADMRVTLDAEGPLSPASLRRAMRPLGLALVEVAPRVLVVRRLATSTRDASGSEADSPVLPEILEEVIVTPDRFDLAGRSFEERETFDAADLARAPLRVGDTLSVVEALPGVALGSEQAAPRIRGGEGRDVLVVMDGLELYEPYHLPDFRSPVSLIDPDSVDLFEVQTGGMSVEFGDRYGGLVRIETPRVPDELLRSLALGSVSSRVGWSQPLGSSSALSLSARAWYPNAVDLTVNVGDDEITPRMSDFFAKLMLPLGARHTLSLHALAAKDTIDYLAAEGDERVDAESRSAYAWGRLTSAWSEDWLSELVVGYGELDRERRGFAVGNAEEDATLDDTRRLELFSFSARVTRRVDTRHLVSGGLDVRRLFASYDYVSIVEGDETSSTRRFDAEPSGTTIGVYLSDRVRLGPRAVLELGARWDEQDYANDDQFSPRAHLALRTGARSLLRISAGRYAQSQRIHELEVQDGVETFAHAEISDQVSASLTQEFRGGWRARIGAYARRLHRLRPRFENLYNPIELFPEVERDRVRIDAERARAEGLELSVASPAEGRRVWGQLSYTLSRAEDREAGRWVPRSWDQPHALTGWVTGRVGRFGALTLSLAARRGWPTTPVNALFDGEGALRQAGETLDEGRNAERLDDYLRFDARFTYARPAGRGTWRVDAGLINLLDRDNQCCRDVTFDPESLEIEDQFEAWTGRAWTLTLAWDF